MLRITLDINGRVIGEITAVLRADSDLPERGNYTVTVREKPFGSTDHTLHARQSFTVTDHQRSEGAMILLQKIAAQLTANPEFAVAFDTQSAQLARRQAALLRGYTIRTDGRIERVCQHGVGHTIGHINKALEQESWVFTHGCDGCCHTFEPFTAREEATAQP
jgi:hypothetical protein